MVADIHGVGKCEICRYNSESTEGRSGNREINKMYEHLMKAHCSLVLMTLLILSSMAGLKPMNIVRYPPFQRGGVILRSFSRALALQS